jgi:hypothetical protein
LKHTTPSAAHTLSHRSRTASRLALVATLAALGVTLLLTGCAHDLGTGSKVVADLKTSYPTTVGKLVTAYLDPSRRLRVYLQICRDADAEGPVCLDEDLRVLAMVESGEKSLLERLAGRYLQDGSGRPVYVYGPMCEGFEEMILVPRCQNAMAIGIWDPNLKDYVVYSTLHGDSLIQSEGFENFLEVTGRAAGVVKKAAKAM